MNSSDVNDGFDDLDASLTSKKRGRDATLAEKAAQEQLDLDDKKNRGNYRCSRCNLPKKGHVCPFQPRYRRREQGNDIGSAMVRDESTQAELDENMTVRALGELDQQGTSESYGVETPSSPCPSPTLPTQQQQQDEQEPAPCRLLSLATLNESFQNVAVDR